MSELIGFGRGRNTVAPGHDRRAVPQDSQNSGDSFTRKPAERRNTVSILSQSEERSMEEIVRDDINGPAVADLSQQKSSLGKRVIASPSGEEFNKKASAGAHLQVVQEVTKKLREVIQQKLSVEELGSALKKLVDKASPEEKPLLKMLTDKHLEIRQKAEPVQASAAAAAASGTSVPKEEIKK